MDTNMALQLRAFPVKVHDCRTGCEHDTIVVLDKSHLQAAQIVGQSSKELIQRICERQGCTVMEIGKADKQEVALNLGELYRAFCRCQRNNRKEVDR